MAEIQCVFTYDEETGKLTKAMHIMAVCQHDKISYISATEGLTLTSEETVRGLNLKEGDLALVKLVKKKDIPKRNVPKFELYYHPTVQHFKCTYTDEDGKERTAGKGVEAPPPGPD